MTQPQACSLNNGRSQTHKGDPVGPTAIEQVVTRFSLASVFADRGVEIGSLDAGQLRDLEEAFVARVSAVVDDLAGRLKDQYESPSEPERIDRELRQQIFADRNRYDTDYECESCGQRHWNDDYFLDFHGLFLCDGCAEHARDLLRDLRQPLIEILEAEPTLENARALGFELQRTMDGRLFWACGDEEYDGDGHPYGNEQEALEGLVSELA